MFLASVTTIMDPAVDETLNDTKVSNTMQKRICLVDKLIHDQELMAATKLLNVPVITSETGKECLAENNCITYFILSEFEGPIFQSLYKASQHQKHK